MMLKSAFRFGVLSVVSAAINIGLTVLLHEVLGFAEEIAVAIAMATVFITSFVMLRYYVYGTSDGSAFQQFLIYAPSALAFRGVEYVVFVLGHTVLGIHYLVVLITVLVTSAIAKFVFYRFVFGERRVS